MLLLVTVPIPRRRARAASCITAMPKASMQREVAVAVWGLYDRPCAQEKGRNVRARRAAKLAYTGTSIRQAGLAAEVYGPGASMA